MAIRPPWKQTGPRRIRGSRGGRHEGRRSQIVLPRDGPRRQEPRRGPARRVERTQAPATAVRSAARPARAGAGASLPTRRRAGRPPRPATRSTTSSTKRRAARAEPAGAQTRLPSPWATPGTSRPAARARPEVTVATARKRPKRPKDLCARLARRRPSSGPRRRTGRIASSPAALASRGTVEKAFRP